MLEMTREYEYKIIGNDRSVVHDQHMYVLLVNFYLKIDQMKSIAFVI